MNKHRAKLLRQTAQIIRGTSLARTLVQPDPKTLESSTRRIYRKLKADWKNTPVDKRAAKASFQKQIVLQAA